MQPDAEDLGHSLAVLRESASTRPYAAPLGYHYEPPEIDEDSDSDLPPPPPPPPLTEGAVQDVSSFAKSGLGGNDAESDSSSDGNCEMGLDDSADMLESLEQLKELEERLSSSEDEAPPPPPHSALPVNMSHQQHQRKVSSSSSSSSDFEEIPPSIRQRQLQLAAAASRGGGQHQRGQIHRNPYIKD